MKSERRVCAYHLCGKSPISRMHVWRVCTQTDKVFCSTACLRREEMEREPLPTQEQ